MLYSEDPESVNTATNTVDGGGVFFCITKHAKLHQWKLESKLVLKEFTSIKLHGQFHSQHLFFFPHRRLADRVPAHGVLGVVQRGVRQGEVDVSVEIVVILVLVEQARQEI